MEWWMIAMVAMSVFGALCGIILLIAVIAFLWTWNPVGR